MCLNFDLAGNEGVYTCHACGVLSSNPYTNTLGHPCCVNKDTGSPFCTGEYTTCLAYNEGYEGFSLGVMGECECEEIASPNEEGVCVVPCGSFEGGECCPAEGGCAFLSLWLHHTVLLALLVLLSDPLPSEASRTLHVRDNVRDIAVAAMLKHAKMSDCVLQDYVFCVGFTNACPGCVGAFSIEKKRKESQLTPTPIGRSSTL